MTVVVAGATGKLGSRIALGLAQHHVPVRALVRQPGPRRALEPLLRAGVEIRRADLEKPASLHELVADASCVVSTATAFPMDRRPSAIDRVDAEGNIALVDAVEAAGTGARFLFVSFRPVPLQFPLQDAKRAVERRLAEARLDSIVLRPGKFMDIWFSPLVGFDVAAARATIFGDGDRPVSWIAAADVAEIAVHAALGHGPAGGTFELGGPEALSQREVVARFEAETGRRFLLDAVPVAILEKQLESADHPADASLAALMLEAAYGAVTDITPMTEAFPIELTTVGAFAGG